MKKDTFGKWFQAKRKKAKYSQRGAAAELGVSHAYISKIEASQLPPPSTDVLWKMGMLIGETTVNMHLQAGKVPPGLKTAFENGLVSVEQYNEMMKIAFGDAS